MGENFDLNFELDSRLKADTIAVRSLELSELLMMNNCHVPWLILVPRRVGCCELTDLTADDQVTLLQEINLLHRVLAEFKPDKINTGALGNVVSQLHIHVLGRYKKDPVWPGPVWGQLAQAPYGEKDREERLSAINSVLDAGHL